ncbi:MAG TPA: adenylate/guanylate cyclase domain-containing protein [Stellaceae bacterium]|nr:adenylate/guanylate cyclase domain-containing protein [Stellaceae bacterium]
MRNLGARWGAQLVDLGTAGHPPHIRRRLKILNAMAYLIVVSSALYAASYAMTDAHVYRWIIAVNLGLVAMGLSIPFLHRIHEILGGLVIAATECAALFALTALLGRQSGIQLNLIVGAAAAFFILGLERLRLCIALVAVCFGLHIAAWLLFPQGMMPAEPGFLDQLYISSALTAFSITALLVYYAFRLAERAEAETEALLRNILPDEIVDRLRARPGEPIAEAVSEASILFSDIEGFVSLSKRLGAARTVALLNEMMRRFDALASRHGVEKIKTIGDAYMAVAGLPQPAPDHAARLARMALDMFAESAAVAAQFGVAFRMRIGIASGPVMAGVIGTRKFSYDVWGDAVNLASRLESSGVPERVHVSAAARRAMAPSFACEPRGEIEIKGLGPTETWLLLDPRAALPSSPMN